MCCVFLMIPVWRSRQDSKPAQNASKRNKIPKYSKSRFILILCYTRSLVKVIFSQYISDICFLFLDNSTLRNISWCINFWTRVDILSLGGLCFKKRIIRFCCSLVPFIHSCTLSTSEYCTQKSCVLYAEKCLVMVMWSDPMEISPTWRGF